MFPPVAGACVGAYPLLLLLLILVAARPHPHLYPWSGFALRAFRVAVAALFAAMWLFYINNRKSA